MCESCLVARCSLKIVDFPLPGSAPLRPPKTTCCLQWTSLRRFSLLNWMALLFNIYTRTVLKFNTLDITDTANLQHTPKTTPQRLFCQVRRTRLCLHSNIVTFGAAAPHYLLYTLMFHSRRYSASELPSSCHKIITISHFPWRLSHNDHHGNNSLPEIH